MKEFMQRLLIGRRFAQRLLAAGDPYVVMVLKALTAMTVLLSINAAFPYRGILTRGLIVAAVSLLCSILPWTYITVFGVIFLLGQLSAFSLEAFAFVLVLVVILAVLSYITLPGCGILWALLPILISWKIPIAAVLLAGLFGGVTAFVSVGSGTILYYVLKLIRDNELILSGADIQTAAGPESTTLVQRLLLLVEGVLKNEEMLIAVLVFCLTTLLVHLLSRTDVDYARAIAVAIGALFCPILFAVACRYAKIQVSAGPLILSAFVGLLVTLAAEFLAVGLDYPHAERVQFEDNEYYYFVKAVPKMLLPEEKARAEAEAAQRSRKATVQAEKGNE